MTPLFAFLPSMGPMEWMIILGLAILLFGRKLPEVGRSLGKGIVEFKKGLKGLEDEVEAGGSSARPDQTAEAPRPPQRITTAAPKFEDQATDSEGKPRYS